MVQPTPPALPAMVQPLRTYLEWNTTMPDILGGTYIGYLKQYAAENGFTSNELKQKVQTTTTALPQVFAALVKNHNDYLVTAIHRPALYASTPGDPSPWDDRLFVFNHDAAPGNYINMVVFPLDGWDAPRPRWIY
ncbi:hypothetical protein ACA910_019388 [Epithemia clementina (nom. ined.)]